jgi:hypothetical protein
MSGAADRQLVNDGLKTSFSALSSWSRGIAAQQKSPLTGV